MPAPDCLPVNDCVAVVARRPDVAFTIEPVLPDAPRTGETLIEIAGTGIWHTDLVFRDWVEA